MVIRTNRQRIYHIPNGNVDWTATAKKIYGFCFTKIKIKNLELQHTLLAHTVGLCLI